LDFAGAPAAVVAASASRTTSTAAPRSRRFIETS
jgi:hypothetical protein